MPLTWPTQTAVASCLLAAFPVSCCLLPPLAVSVNFNVQLLGICLKFSEAEAEAATAAAAGKVFPFPPFSPPPLSVTRFPHAHIKNLIRECPCPAPAPDYTKTDQKSKQIGPKKLSQQIESQVEAANFELISV